MANVLTNLAADIYKAADRVGRELTGISSSVTINANGSERAALNDTVRSHFTRAVTPADVTPSMTIPEGTDQTVDSKTLTLNKFKGVPIPWTGEDIKHVDNGSGFETIYGDQIAQAMRGISNMIESDLATEIYKNASRAFGTAGTTPFASNFNDIAELRQIIVDNGGSQEDLYLALSTTAGTKLRNLAQLQKANEGGGTDLLRQGVLLDLQGIRIKESAQIKLHTKGTGSGYLSDLVAGYGVGDTAIHVDTGTGTILQGDVVTFAGDANKYVIGTGFAGDGDGDIALHTPGLRATLANDVAMTIGNTYTANVCFARSAVELAIRGPAQPPGGDAAVDEMFVQDPFSGLVFRVAFYKGFMKSMIHVSAVWGVKAWKPDNIALLLG